MKDRSAKLALMKQSKSGDKRKAELGSGSASTPPTKVARLEASSTPPQLSQESSGALPDSQRAIQPSSSQKIVLPPGGTHERGLASTTPSPAEVEKALETVSRLLPGSTPPCAVEGRSSQPSKISKSE